MTSIIKLGILSAISAGALFFYSFPKPKQTIQLNQNKSVQQIIRDVYIRINTKENMAVVKQMYQLECSSNIQIIQPYEYTLKTGGKKIRLIMAAVVSEMFTGVSEDGKVAKEIIQVGGLIELLHSASLIIDDIQDGSLQRRGEPCSHLVYGLDRSINAANLMYFQAFRKLFQNIQDPYKKRQILKIFIEQMTISHMGQAQDVMVHKTKLSQQLPTLKQYQLLTIAKTSSLLRMMVKMLCVILNRSKKQSQQLSQVMNYVGLAFQITDDVLNLTKNLGKGEIAQDLKQKKFTPIIHYMRQNEQFIKLFIKQNKDDQTINIMLDMIIKSNTLAQTQKLAQKYQQIAEELIKNMKTPYSKNNFQKLMKFIITRQN